MQKEVEELQQEKEKLMENKVQEIEALKKVQEELRVKSTAEIT